MAMNMTGAGFSTPANAPAIQSRGIDGMQVADIWGAPVPTFREDALAAVEPSMPIFDGIRPELAAAGMPGNMSSQAVHFDSGQIPSAAEYKPGMLAQMGGLQYGTFADMGLTDPNNPNAPLSNEAAQLAEMAGVAQSAPPPSPSWSLGASPNANMPLADQYASMGFGSISPMDQALYTNPAIEVGSAIDPTQVAQQAAQNASPGLVQPEVSQVAADPRMGNQAAVDATMSQYGMVPGQQGVYGADDAPGKKGGMLSALAESASSRMSPKSIAGALAGGAVAGPFGAIIGGLLGSQIGKPGGMFESLFSGGNGFGFGGQQSVSGGTRSVSADGNWSTFSPTGSGRTNLSADGGPVPGLSTYDANGDGRFGGIFDGFFG
jgi:hypothetical protein